MEVNMDSTHQISNGHKFGILAISGLSPRLPSDFQELEIQGVDFSKELPGFKEDIWKDWLGSIRLEEIKNAELVVLLTVNSSRPIFSVPIGNLDTRFIEETCHAEWNAAVYFCGASDFLKYVFFIHIN